MPAFLRICQTSTLDLQMARYVTAAIYICNALSSPFSSAWARGWQLLTGVRILSLCGTSAISTVLQTWWSRLYTCWFRAVHHSKILLQVNLGGLLAWEFLLMHWVEVRRYQDIKKHHSVDQDPIFKNNKVGLSEPLLMLQKGQKQWRARIFGSWVVFLPSSRDHFP